jgi:hypothetical protein
MANRPRSEKFRLYHPKNESPCFKIRYLIRESLGSLLSPSRCVAFRTPETHHRFLLSFPAHCIRTKSKLSTSVFFREDQHACADNAMYQADAVFSWRLKSLWSSTHRNEQIQKHARTSNREIFTKIVKEYKTTFYN